MSRTSALLDRMRRNPAADWRMGDIARVCVQLEIRCSPPTGGGSHWKISDPTQREILTIPERRPVKVVYIRKLVKFIDAIVETRNAGS
jgi:hypothetical protein